MIKRFFKTVRLPIRRTPTRVAFSMEKYQSNGNTAMRVYKPTLLGYKEIDVISVNFTTDFPGDVVCLDTNNHGKELEDAFSKYQLGEKVGMYESGFCKYPIFLLDLNRIQKYSIAGQKHITY